MALTMTNLSVPAVTVIEISDQMTCMQWSWIVLIVMDIVYWAVKIFATFVYSYKIIL